MYQCNVPVQCTSAMYQCNVPVQCTSVNYKKKLGGVGVVLLMFYLRIIEAYKIGLFHYCFINMFYNLMIAIFNLQIHSFVCI